MASIRVTEADLRAEIEAHRAASMTHVPSPTRGGPADKRARTHCAACGGPLTRKPNRGRGCVPCQREANRLRNLRWARTPIGKASRAASYRKWVAKQRARDD